MACGLSPGGRAPLPRRHPAAHRAFAGGQATSFPSGSTADRILATVMFSDIVSSTERAAEIGDLRWRDVLDRHDELVRKQIGDHGGREIKTTGDGFLALFDAPARAIRCAISIEKASSRGRRRPDRAPPARSSCAGTTSAGSPSASALSGGVRLGRRRCGVEHGEDLVAGSGIEFDDLGRHALKGVPDAWRLFAVAELGPR